MAVLERQAADGQIVSLSEWKKLSQTERDRRKAENPSLRVEDSDHGWLYTEPSRRYTPAEWLQPKPAPEPLLISTFRLAKLLVHPMADVIRQIPEEVRHIHLPIPHRHHSGHAA